MTKHIKKALTAQKIKVKEVHELGVQDGRRLYIAFLADDVLSPVEILVAAHKIPRCEVASTILLVSRTQLSAYRKRFGIVYPRAAALVFQCEE